MTPDGARWTGRVELIEKQIDQPRRWKSPRRIFVNSMSDTFHEGLPDEARKRIWHVMSECPRHVFQVLTKRAENMRRWLRVCALEFQPLPNVWIGVSVEDQKRAEERIPLLLETPAAVRFLSVEPLIGPVDLSPWLTLGISWVIIGAESGPGARPMRDSWAHTVIDQCRQAGVPVFFKQAVVDGKLVKLPTYRGRQFAEYPV